MKPEGIPTIMKLTAPHHRVCRFEDKGRGNVLFKIARKPRYCSFGPEVFRPRGVVGGCKMRGIYVWICAGIFDIKRFGGLS